MDGVLYRYMYAMVAFLTARTAALPFVDVFGTASVQCSGAQIVATSKSLLVFGICAPNGLYPSKNLTINMRKSYRCRRHQLHRLQRP